jgi:cytochrome P450
MTELSSATDADQAEVARLAKRFDHHDPNLGIDTVFDVYGHLQQVEGVAWTEAHGGYWVVTHAADVRAAELAPEVFTSSEGVFNPGHPPGEPLIPLELDGDFHVGIRELYMDLLNIRNVRQQEPYIRGRVDALLAEFHGSGGGDFVEIAARLPIDVVGEIIGFDDEFRSRVRECVDRTTAGLGEKMDAAKAGVDLMALIAGAVTDRQDNPRDDKLTAVINAEIDGKPLTQNQLFGFLTAYLVAGYMTTAHGLAAMVFELARDRSLQDRLRGDRKLIPTMVEETLRFHPPVHSFFRTATEDTEVRGCPIAAGDKVALMFGAANRDPERFEDPDTFHPDRENARQHMAFGFGAHVCAGAHLARAEMRIVLEALIEQYPPFELDGEPRWPSRLVIGHHLGLEYLPIRFVN